MAYDEEVYEKLLKNFELLCTIIQQNTSGNQMKADLTKIEEIIKKKIPETLKKNAPEDFYELYTDFKSEYEKFLGSSGDELERLMSENQEVLRRLKESE